MKNAIKFNLVILAFVIAFGFYSTAFAVGSIGVLNVEIVQGKVASVGLNSTSSGIWSVTSNTNSAIASGAVQSNTLILTGAALGTTKLTLCEGTELVNCLEINATVKTAGSILGAYTNNSHPVNSWVLSGKTVFYIHVNGIIPISTWAIFINNGGKQSLIQNANDGDLKLPLLGLMDYNDSRVTK